MTDTPDSTKSKAESFELPTWATTPTDGNVKARFDAFKQSKLVGTYMVGTKVMSIFGRDKDTSDFVLANPSISRNHAAIIHDSEGGVYLVDLTSSHGTYLNKRKISPNDPNLLHEGDTVRFGQSARLYKFKNADPDGLSAPVKRWPKMKLRPPRISLKSSKPRYDPKIIKLVNSMCNSTITDESMESFLKDVKELPDDEIKDVANALIDKVKVKFDLHASSVHRNSLKTIFELVKNNIGLTYFEQNFGVISQISQARSDSDARSLARKILQLLAKVLVDPDGDHSDIEDPTTLTSGNPGLTVVIPPLQKKKDDKQVETSQSTASDGSRYSPPVPAPLASISINSVDSLNAAANDPTSTDASSTSNHQSPVYKNRQRVLSNEGKRLFVDSHRVRGSFDQSTRPTSPHLTTQESQNSIVSSPPGSPAGFSFINNSENPRLSNASSGPGSPSGFGFMSNSISTESLDSKRLPANLNSSKRNQTISNVPFGFLSATPGMNPADFEGLWENAHSSEEWESYLIALPKPNELEKILESKNMKCLASGKVGNTLKFYFFAEQASNGTIFMVEVNIMTNILHLNATFKWVENALLYDDGHKLFMELFQESLQHICKSKADIGKDIFVQSHSTREQLMNVPVENMEELLKETPYVDPSSFEGLWNQSAVIAYFENGLSRIPTTEELNILLHDIRLICLASGTVNKVEKFFLYAELIEHPVLFLVELSVDSIQFTVHGTVKLHSQDNNFDKSKGESYGTALVQLIQHQILEE